MQQLVDIHTHRQSDFSFCTLTTIGIHPYDAHSADAVRMEAVERGAASVDAIGEIGLDFACSTARNVQISIFHRQLAIAEKQNKAVVLHCVRAFEEVMKILAEYRLQAVIFHGFIGSTIQAQRAIERGYYLSFGERILRSPKTIEALRIVPLSQLFVETDESDTPLEKIYEQIAALRNISTAELGEATRENFEKIITAR